MALIKSWIGRNRTIVNFIYGTIFWLEAFGIRLLRMGPALRGIPFVIKDYINLKKQNQQHHKQWSIGFTMPCFHDRYDLGGVASGDYFHQDLRVAQKIFQQQPHKHVDVGSRIDGFVAHVAAYRSIEVFDIRPVSSQADNIVFKQADFMKLPDTLHNYCDSLSCLHALEHFGLGRYGDPIDVKGYEKGFDSLYKMLKPNGTLYLSVPIGRERVEFNAHRVFSISTILELAQARFELQSFDYVDDQGNLHKNPKLSESDYRDSFHLNYGCGIFEFRKT